MMLSAGYDDSSRWDLLEVMIAVMMVVRMVVRMADL
jgi:hypothetical protein